MCEATPEEEAARQGFDVGQNRGACCGEARHCLKKGIGVRRECAGEDKRQSAEGCGKQPAERDDGKPLAHPHILLEMGEPYDQQAGDSSERRGKDKGEQIGRRIVVKGEWDRHQHGAPQKDQKPAFQVKNAAQIHVVCRQASDKNMIDTLQPFWRYGSSR